MNSFTNDTKGYEEYLAYKAFKIFFDSYLIDRDYEGLQSSVFLHNHPCSQLTVYLEI